MIVLLDTNIVGRLAQTDHAVYPVAAASVDRLLKEGNELRVVPQVLYEFWSIATRPISENGFGFTSEKAAKEIDRIRAVFPPLRDERGVLGFWDSLVRKYDVRGKKSHDARLVAAMQRHGISKLLTFNGDDFHRYTEIEVLDPEAIASQA